MSIEWNRVTWYSKVAAIILGVGIFLLGFYLGREFGKLSTSIDPEVKITS
jgi:hypothetical protein